MNKLKQLLEDRIDERIEAAVRKNVDDSDPYDYRDIPLNEFIRYNLDSIIDDNVVYETLEWVAREMIMKRFDLVHDETLYQIEDERDYQQTLKNLPY